ncbi:uncharacterized protein [Drosophila tropicalis]|uniref:uncharacterized protein n=1 Tax=Drosophila tropicalis TaxID=46794 RepID=UPI0035AC07FA
MPRATDTDIGEDHLIDEHGGALKFRTFYRGSVKQNSVHEFLSSTIDGDNIALLGSTTTLVTLEMTSKANCRLPFPFIVASSNLPNNGRRPLDELAKQANLPFIYEQCHVLEAQQFTLEPVYVAICSTELPKPKLIAAKWSPQIMPNKKMLLASLNSHGVFLLLTKPVECTRWKELNGLDVAVHLRDVLQKPYKVNPSEIKSFQDYQNFIDRSWITIMAWGPSKFHFLNHTLILGTASGHIWVLILSPDCRRLVDHWQMQTDLNRICFMQVFQDLLLVGDVNGLVNLYNFASESLELTLVKNLWLKPDRMGIQQAEITYCRNRNCTYITFCKGAHLLTWCEQSDGNWLETRLYVGGMKITALAGITSDSYVLATAQSKIYQIEVVHKSNNHLSLTMKPLQIKGCENYQILGLFNSRHKNLYTAVLSPKKEYLQTTSKLRNKLHVHVGSIHQRDPLIQLAANLKLNEPINSSADLLAEVRLTLFFKKSMQKYLNFSSLEYLQFHQRATEEQLQHLQLVYHILTPIYEMQTKIFQYSCRNESTKCRMDLLIAMLTTTHMRLRLQYLASLSAKIRTPFQILASQKMFQEFARLKRKLQSNLDADEQPDDIITRHFLDQMDIHFEDLREQLHVKAGKDEQQDQLGQPLLLCSISYVEMPLSLDRCYCTLCSRPILMQMEKLEQLYENGAKILLFCPFCHGSYQSDLF